MCNSPGDCRPDPNNWGQRDNRSRAGRFRGKRDPSALPLNARRPEPHAPLIRARRRTYPSIPAAARRCPSYSEAKRSVQRRSAARSSVAVAGALGDLGGGLGVEVLVADGLRELRNL